MSAVLLFAGTFEGRILAERLVKEGISVEACVATEYGVQVLKGNEGIKLHQGRLSVEEMRALYEQGDYFAVVDCTHPFATVVSENIKESLKGTKLPFIRVRREWGENHAEGNEAGAKHENGEGKRLECFVNAKACAEALLKRQEFQRILLTTGSKELDLFCRDEKLREKLVVRVLPGRESMECCWNLGLEGKQIIAMQGVSTKEMNLAVIRQYGIDCLVTKESGKAGGEDEKLAAAKEAGIPCMLIARPIYGEEFMECTEQEAFQRIMELSGKIAGEKADAAGMNIVLAGIGMGTEDTMTMELKRVIEKTDYLFGAPRLLAQFTVKCEKYPYYLAKDILPEIKKIKDRHASQGGRCNVTILFSGDSGFYSGCRGVREALMGLEGVTVTVLPGISSLAAFCAKIGEEWQDALILSAHGVDAGEWAAKMLHGLRRHKKVFLLTSGDEDVRQIGTILESANMEPERIWVGYQISYREERIFSLTVADCKTVFARGLYVIMIIPRQSDPMASLVPSLKDDDFIRDKVPMTKEEIRELSICKLRLTEESVIYDIGSGTGSIGVQIAALSGSLKVYAIECEEDALKLTRQNQWKFGLENLHVVQGMAPDAFEELPPPTHAFIGGTKGRLREILEKLYEKNPTMRIVINTVSLEGSSQLQEVLREISSTEPEFVTIQVSKAKKMGEYHLMTANNPVTICSFAFVETEKADINKLRS